MRPTVNPSKPSSTLLATLARGISAAMAGLLLSYILSGFAQILVVRQLGKLLYGEYATLTATLGLIASLLGFGLDVWVLSEGGRSQANLASTIAHVLRAKLIGAAVLVILIGIAWFNQIVQAPVFLVGALGIILDSFVSTGYSALRALNRNGVVAIFQVIAPLVLLVALWFTQQTGGSVLLLFCIQTGTSAVMAAILLRFLYRFVGPIFKQRFHLRYLVQGAWLFVISDILSNIYTQSSVVILGRMVDQTAVGIWKPALNLIGLTFLVPSLLFLVGLPQLNAVAQVRQQYRRLLAMLSVGAIVYGLVVCVMLWLFTALIIQLLFGREYDAALPLVRTMSLVPLFKSGSFVCVAIMLSLNQQRLRVMLQAIVTIISLAGGLLLIPRFGLPGAVWLYVAIEALIFSFYLAAALTLLRRTWR